jgi:hypothetical protein
MSKMMSSGSEDKVTQVTLRAEGGRLMTTWLDANPKIFVGNKVKLKKEDGTWWLITEVFATQPASSIDTHGWDNNDYSKHEGLFK